MQLVIAVLIAVQLQLGAAVKAWMFKKCDENPFCDRNRNYAEAPDASLYFVDASSVDFNDPQHITGNVLKQLSAEESEVAVGATQDMHVVLPFTLDVVTDGIVHFTVDEAGRKLELENAELAAKLNANRFDPAEYMLDAAQAQHRKPSTRPSVSSHTHDGLVVDFGESQAVLEFAPLKLSVLHKGEEQVVLNKHNFLNFEHLRKKRENERNADWEDRFDKYTDRHVRGPESVALDTSFTGYTALYGIPEHADSLSLRDTRNAEPYRLFNVDIFEYETQSPMAMYGTIPFITAQKPGHAAGVFWLNAADTYVDIAKLGPESRAHWMSETGVLDVYVIVGNTPREVLASYGLLTGTAQLPQQFSIGYHQCRWNYQTQDELLGVNEKMDEHAFPYDVIWLDIEWTDDRRYFAWDTDRFPDSEEMMRALDETKRKLVVLNDPHIKAKPDYEVFTDLRDNGLLVRDEQGTADYHAHCWPGQSAWVDSLNPAAWPFWEKFHALGTKLGGWARNLYIWSDMSEPSVFSGSETTAYKSVLHHGGWQHRDVHNLYGHTIFNMTYDALKARYNGEQRPFILTRSFFAGSQKLGPTWTGDNQAEWAYLQAATPMVLTLGVSGYPFAGADVGGFFRNPSDELLVRWYQSGVFYPFFREHAHVESRYREPYLLGPDLRDTVRTAIELRYQLIPELYTSFWDANQELQPIMRPLFYEYPELTDLYEVEDQFFFGPSLMAKPVTEEGATSVDIRLPGNDLFYDYFTGAEVSQGGAGHTLRLANIDINTVPLFVRGGSVVFRRDRKRRSTELMQNDPYTLLVAVDRDGKAHGHLYADDGVSFEYETRDDYLVTDVDVSENVIRARVRHASASPFANREIERIIVYGAEASRAEVAGGSEATVLPTEHGFVIRKPQVKIGDNWVIQLQ